MKKRNLFEELMLGVAEMKAQREGKITRQNGTVQDASNSDRAALKIIGLQARTRWITKR